ncbi:hypothetical protein [Tunturibacter empetritectus]|uniref:Uncharacterized protein n=1 Tax=Tunturiibacter lichenicola TaxID=2051959 RepID=A0A7W8J6H4_9BACT|nr:hypothetical protein [Edaphobacter lichenicola]MBB5342441.1 hypothetical protein [Edaphobacter lichenicola]
MSWFPQDELVAVRAALIAWMVLSNVALSQEPPDALKKADAA